MIGSLQRIRATMGYTLLSSDDRVVWKAAAAQAGFDGSISLGPTDQRALMRSIHQLERDFDAAMLLGDEDAALQIVSRFAGYALA